MSLGDHTSSHVVRGVLKGMTSLGLCWDVVDIQGLMSKPYRTDRLAMVMHPMHELASYKQLDYVQTLAYQQVGLPPTIILQILLKRVAAGQEATSQSRAVVSNFDAALRVVHADLAIAVVPIEVARIYADAMSLRVIPLTDAWARREFIVCFRSKSAFSQAARLLLDPLAKRSGEV